MYHAIAKMRKEYPGGTDLRKNLATFLEINMDKYKVRIHASFFVHVKVKYLMELARPYIRHYPLYFQNLVNHFVKSRNLNIKQYIKGLRNKKEQGGFLEIFLICKMLKTNMSIVTMESSWTLYKNVEAKDVLGYNGSNRWYATGKSEAQNCKFKF